MNFTLITNSDYYRALFIDGEMFDERYGPEVDFDVGVVVPEIIRRGVVPTEFTEVRLTQKQAEKVFRLQRRPKSLAEFWRKIGPA